MLFSSLVQSALVLLVLGGESAARPVRIEPDPSPSGFPLENDAAAAPSGPGVKLEHDLVVQQLRVQRALRESRELLARSRHREAIDRLEPWLAHAEGCPTFLAVLETAYRGEIARLMAEKESDKARLLAERLRALSPSAPQEGTAAAPASLAGRSEETPLAPAAASTKEEKPVLARAKLEEPAPPRNESPLERAERLFSEQNYSEALAAYERAYELDPEGVQLGRERWGYCLLYVSILRYNELIRRSPEEVGPEVWEKLVADVRLSRRLAPMMVQTDEVLRSITQQQDRSLAASPSREKDKEVASTSPSVGRYSQSAVKDVPARSFRHLPGRSQSWSVAESANFRIFHRDPALAEEVARLAEEARDYGMDMWFPGEGKEQWSPRCDIYLYPTSHEYGQATGVGPQSPGHSKVQNDLGRIVSRMVALRADDPSMKDAVLPHEVTHVVLAGRFGAHVLPRWADEGMAVLTEPRSKQDSHLVNLVRSRQGSTGFNCAEVLSMREYPGGHRMLDFYAHSVGICRYLVEKNGPRKLVQFLRISLETGNYEQGLRQVYGKSFAELESEFSRFVSGLGGPNGSLAAAVQ